MTNQQDKIQTTEIEQLLGFVTKAMFPGSEENRLLDQMLVKTFGDLLYKALNSTEEERQRAIGYVIGEILFGYLLSAGIAKAADCIGDFSKVARGAIEIADDTINIKGQYVDDIAKYADDVAEAGKQLDNVLLCLRNTDNFADETLEHIFSGMINKKTKKAVGFHYEGLDGVDGKVLEIIEPPNKYGVYKAEVKIAGKVKNGTSSFFPKDWTPQQVVDAINEAFENKELVKGKTTLYQGTSKTGIKIRMYVENNKITSAWPMYE